MTGKRELRAEARARLAALQPSSLELAGKQIDVHVWSLPETTDARTMLLYASLPGEVPTAGIAAMAWSRGIRVVYPRTLRDGRGMTLHAVESPEDLREGGAYGIREPLLVCVPVPLSDAIPLGNIDAAIGRAIQDAMEDGIRGKAVTPFLLRRIAEQSGGASLEANVALLRNNARVAADIAVAVAQR